MAIPHTFRNVFDDIIDFFLKRILLIFFLKKKGEVNTVVYCIIITEIFYYRFVIENIDDKSFHWNIITILGISALKK